MDNVDKLLDYLSDSTYIKVMRSMHKKGFRYHGYASIEKLPKKLFAQAVSKDPKVQKSFLECLILEYIGKEGLSESYQPEFTSTNYLGAAAHCIFFNKETENLNALIDEHFKTDVPKSSDAEEQKLNVLKDKLEKELKKTERLKKKNQELGKANKDLVEKHAILENQLLQTKSENASLIKQIEDKQHEILTLQGIIKAKEKTIIELKTIIQSLNEKKEEERIKVLYVGTFLIDGIPEKYDITLYNSSSRLDESIDFDELWLLKDQVSFSLMRKSYQLRNNSNCHFLEFFDTDALRNYIKERK